MTQATQIPQDKIYAGEKKVPCLVMTRVVGYYAAVQDFNVGKKQEFKDRVNYRVPKVAELNERQKS